MKTIILITSLTLLISSGLYAGDYILSIDDQSVEIDLNKESKFTTPEGEELTVILKQKEYLEFKGQFFSMKHKNTLKPSTTDLGDGIFQTLMATPTGTMVLIQEYTNMNPESLVDMMLKELTKEEIDYGYKYKERKIERSVNGKEIHGKQAITTHDEQEWTRAVFTYGEEDQGILFVTMIEKDEYDNEQHILSDFWKDLSLSLD